MQDVSKRYSVVYQHARLVNTVIAVTVYDYRGCELLLWELVA